MKKGRFFWQRKFHFQTSDLLHIDSQIQLGFLFRGRWHVISREKIRGESATWDLFDWGQNESIATA